MEPEQFTETGYPDELFAGSKVARIAKAEWAY